MDGNNGLPPSGRSPSYGDCSTYNNLHQNLGRYSAIKKKVNFKRKKLKKCYIKMKIL